MLICRNCGCPNAKTRTFRCTEDNEEYLSDKDLCDDCIIDILKDNLSLGVYAVLMEPIVFKRGTNDT